MFVKCLSDFSKFLQASFEYYDLDVTLLKKVEILFALKGSSTLRNVGNPVKFQRKVAKSVSSREFLLIWVELCKMVTEIVPQI